MKLLTNKRVIAITEKDQRLPMAKQYIDNIEIVNGFESISWHDIFLRKIQLIAVPSKTEAYTINEKLKRKAIKLLELNLSRLLGQINIEDCLFNNHGAKVLFAPANSIIQIYKYHLPQDFTVLELKDELHASRLAKLVKRADQAVVTNNLDEAPGITVFTNLRNDTSVRIYKKIHPNRHIILRYHDRIDGGLGPKPNKRSLLSMIQKLRDDRIIDEVESYYKQDALLMGGIYRPNGVNPSKIKDLECNARYYLYRFIGGPKNITDKSRTQALKALNDKINEIYPNASKYIEERFVVGVKNRVSYSQYLKDISLSEVIIDIARIGQEEGFSYRVPEALFLNKKIISDRKLLLDEPFYSKDRIFIIGIDKMDRLKDFLEKDLPPLPQSILNLYNSCKWWTQNDPIKTCDKLITKSFKS